MAVGAAITNDHGHRFVGGQEDMPPSQFQSAEDVLANGNNCNKNNNYYYNSNKLVLSKLSRLLFTFIIINAKLKIAGLFTFTLCVRNVFAYELNNRIYK